MKLGIVDKVVSADKLDDAALKIAMGFAQKPFYTISGIKRIMRCDMSGLKDSLECENKVLESIIMTNSMRTRLGK